MKIVSGSDELAGTLPKSNVIDRAETKPPPCTSRANTAQALETRTDENAGAKTVSGSKAAGNANPHETKSRRQVPATFSDGIVGSDRTFPSPPDGNRQPGFGANGKSVDIRQGPYISSSALSSAFRPASSKSQTPSSFFWTVTVIGSNGAASVLSTTSMIRLPTHLPSSSSLISTSSR